MNGLWAGPRGGEQWIKAPDAGGGSFDPVGWSTKSGYTNGGAGFDGSLGAHMEYDFAWETMSRAEARKITDIKQGLRGPGLVYLIEPMSADQNVLPQSWAFPAQACYDAVPLIGDARPSKTITAENNWDYPAESAEYRLTTGAGRKLYIPIPPDHAAWVGVHGAVPNESLLIPSEFTLPGVDALVGVSSGTGGLCVTPFIGSTSTGEDIYPAMLSVDDRTRMNTSFSGNVFRGIELSLKGNGAASSILLSGMMVQILPIGQTPAEGGFISGQGNSGCKIESATPTPISLVYDKVSLVARFTEIGDWL